ncbi:ADC synthase [Chaetomium fimeti]|uniref:aminodeoxychorismate synthase n=1 Tax=Chaetomium fimeti TaxID=1854472 RepID=A0AAE0HKW5_9PEZI|nr:ADC synthase [Chaetomium fimeti]
MHRPRILFLDAHDSFSNNITSLLATLLNADVFVLPIDDPLLPSQTPTNLPNTSTATTTTTTTTPPNGPKDDPRRARFIAELARYDAVVCGPGPGSPDNDADVGLMRHVWSLANSELLPVLGGDVGEAEWEAARWEPFGACPDLVPLAWVEEQREDTGTERILMAVKHKAKPFWGVQYHPESVCTEEEGNKVILNWFRQAQRWNEEMGRVLKLDGHGLARTATKPSLLSQLDGWPTEHGTRQWWEVLEANPELHCTTVPLPDGVQIPDIVEAVASECSERIVLDSANAAPATSRADVRGRYSIIAAGLDEALRIEHHVGDSYATIKVGSFGGSPVNLTDKIPLDGDRDVWGLIAAFHQARHLPATEPSYTPFVGGFMGYITYEQGLSRIGVSLEQPRPHHRPDVSLAWVTKSVVVDHLQQEIHVQHLSSANLERGSWMDQAADKLRSLQNPQRRPSFNKPVVAPSTLPLKSRRPSMSVSIQPPQTKEYEAKVRVCQEYIAAGESYELCLTDQTSIIRPQSDTLLRPNTAHLPPSSRKEQQQQQHLPVHPSPSPSTPSSSSWALFKRLRRHQPAPFASYLRLGGATLVSASPERFLTYDRGGRCSMRPMKGTVRKSARVATLAQAERILHVPKEEAENLMIVDLVRHDLHGVCGAGRVCVPDLLRVEEYQSVFQMITVVEGRLPPALPASAARDGKAAGGGGYTGLDVLAASLPPGSMTGAPKKRSCEILQEIEGHKERGLYSGVVGYMCATGRGDWSVTIRSLFRWDDEQVVVNGDEGPETHEVWRIGAGGAVTILSTPEGEREEMFTKLAGPLRIFGEEPGRE